MQTQGFQFTAPGAQLSRPQISPLQFVSGETLAPSSGVESFVSAKLQGLNSLLEGVKVGVGGIVDGVTKRTQLDQAAQEAEQLAKYRDRMLSIKEDASPSNLASGGVWSPGGLSQVEEPDYYNPSPSVALRPSSASELQSNDQAGLTPLSSISEDTIGLPVEDADDEQLNGVMEGWRSLTPAEKTEAMDWAKSRGVNLIENADGSVSADWGSPLVKVPDPMADQVVRPERQAPLASVSESSIGVWSTDKASGLSKLTQTLPDGSTRVSTYMPDPKNPSVPKLVEAFTITPKDPEKAAKTEAGKELLSEQMKVLSNLNSAEFTLKEIEERFNKIASGPITGRARGANPYDVDAQEIERLVDSLVPGLARGVFGEVGVLTDNDMKRYRAMIPNMSTEPEVAKRMFKNLYNKLKNSRTSNLNVWKDAGYNVEQIIKNLPASSTELPTIRSQAEYDQLPKGTRYQNENGEIGVKN